MYAKGNKRANPKLIVGPMLQITWAVYHRSLRLHVALQNAKEEKPEKVEKPSKDEKPQKEEKPKEDRKHEPQQKQAPPSKPAPSKPAPSGGDKVSSAGASVSSSMGLQPALGRM